MSDATSESARVVNAAAGVEGTDRTAPVRDGRHQAFAVLIGKWINEGHTAGTGEIPSVPILTSDVYEWAPAGSSSCTRPSGRSAAHHSRLEIEGKVLRWIGDRTRCTLTMTDDGMTQVACHESTAGGVNWTASMDVTLSKVA